MVAAQGYKVIIVSGRSDKVCGCDGPTAIHRWASNRADWLKGFLPLANGIPSRDCIRRLLMALQPQASQKCFQGWIANAVQGADGNTARLVAIGGKACRRSHDAARGLGPLHLVSAWASEEGIALGQVAADQKSNEIAAIPLLLKQIDLKGAVVTIDAMGCQKEIAATSRRGAGTSRSPPRTTSRSCAGGRGVLPRAPGAGLRGVALPPPRDERGVPRPERRAGVLVERDGSD